MSGETTTSTLDDITNSGLVQDTLIMALSEQPGLYRFCRQFDVRDQAATSFKVPIQHSFWGAPNDDGAGLDSEFDGPGQMVAASYTAVASDGVTCTPAEYVVAHGVSDNVIEDSVQGIDLMQLFTGTMTKVLALAFDDDYVAQFANLSQIVGSTGVDLTVANMLAAQTGARTRGAVADQYCYVLDNQQSADLDAALTATNAAAAIYAGSADRLLGYSPSADNGMGPNRSVGQFRKAEIFASGLTDTANTAADVNGAFICPSTTANDLSGATTHGMFIKRLPSIEFQRQALKRGTDIVCSARVGFVELQDASGTLIQTDA